MNKKRLKDFERVHYISEMIKSTESKYHDFGGYKMKDGAPNFYLNGALQMYDVKQGEVEILETLLTQALDRLNKFEKTGNKDYLESLRWVLESI